MPKRARCRSKSAVSYSRKKRAPSRAVVWKSPMQYSMYRGIVPDKLITTLRYVTAVNITDGTTGYAVHLFRANDIYDPDYSGVGHQPMGHDELANLYANYRVKKCKITVQASQNQSTIQTIFGISPTELPSTLANYYRAAEQPGAVSALVAQDTGGPNVKTLSLTMDIAKFDGNQGASTSDDLQAAMNASPIDVKYFQVWSANPTSGVTVDTQLYVTLEYYVELFNRAVLQDS